MFNVIGQTGIDRHRSDLNRRRGVAHVPHEHVVAAVGASTERTGIGIVAVDPEVGVPGTSLETSAHNRHRAAQAAFPDGDVEGVGQCTVGGDESSLAGLVSHEGTTGHEFSGPERLYGTDQERRLDGQAVMVERADGQDGQVALPDGVGPILEGECVGRTRGARRVSAGGHDHGPGYDERSTSKHGSP